MDLHSYLVDPGGPRPGTAGNFKISVNPNHIHFDIIAFPHQNVHVHICMYVIRIYAYTCIMAFKL